MNNRLFFLFITSDKFPLFRVDLTVLFGKELVKRNVSIDWLLQSQKTCLKPYKTKWQGYRVWVTGNIIGKGFISRFAKHLFKLINIFRMFSLAFGKGYDFIQVKDAFLPAIAAIIIKKINKTPFVYWQSYPFVEHFLERGKTEPKPCINSRKGYIYGILLYRFILPRADHVFVQSMQMKKDITAKGVDPGKITPVPMGIDLTSLPDDKTNLSPQIELTKPALVFVGMFFKVRHLDFLIRVISIVHQKIPSAKLYMIGRATEVEDQKFLTNEVKRLNLSNVVEFTGFLPLKEALMYIKESDICLSPYYPSFILNSTSPTKLIEYMAMGKAVIATDHPEQRNIIEESGGGICTPYNEEAFADAIITLLTDPEKCRSMGEKGRAYIKKKRNYKKIADFVEKQYNIIARHNRMYKKI